MRQRTHVNEPEPHTTTTPPYQLQLLLPVVAAAADVTECTAHVLHASYDIAPHMCGMRIAYYTLFIPSPNPIGGEHAAVARAFRLMVSLCGVCVHVCCCVDTCGRTGTTSPSSFNSRINRCNIIEALRKVSHRQQQKEEGETGEKKKTNHSHACRPVAKHMHNFCLFRCA